MPQFADADVIKYIGKAVARGVGKDIVMAAGATADQIKGAIRLSSLSIPINMATYEAKLGKIVLRKLLEKGRQEMIKDWERKHQVKK